MQTLNLVQGSPEWLAHRRTSFNASDAPAMMGCSPHKTRTALLHELHTGIAPEHDAATERRFADGHRFEALARPLAQDIVGEELYPVTGAVHAFDLSRQLSASFDGLTLLGDMGFEHKSLNDELRAIQHFVGQQLPLHYRVQMEHQMLVSGADKILFMASKWAGDELVEERHCWYASDASLRAEILAGWKQFDADLAAYVAPAAAAPAPTGRAPESLPALLVQVTGAVTASNLAEFKEIALSAIRSVNRELTTDQHFADAAKAVKWCSDVEERIDAAKEHALSQTASIDALFKVMDDIKAEARQTRLDLDRLVKARNVALKTEIVTAAQQALAKHIAGLNERLGRPYMPTVPADFAGAIHGKKSFDSMRAALDATLANAKIFANEVADRIDANLKYLREHAKDHTALFPDTAQIVLKAQDDLQALATSRIAQHKEAEQRRLDAERQRIREEEQARADREARDRLAAEQGAQQATQAPAALPGVNAVSISNALNTGSIPRMGGAGLDTGSVPVAANVVPLSRPAAPAVDTGARVKLGDINAAIAPLSISADGLAALGFKHEPAPGSAKQYRQADLPAIYAAMVRHIEAGQAKQAA